MSADLLRRAAAQMRERAQGATAGRWIELGVLDADRGERWNAVGTERDIEVEVARLEYSPDGSCNTAHIASWHPDVALAVADLLDLAAEHQKREGDDCGQGYGPDGYGDIDPSCSVCGTPDEYAEPWPCAYAQKGLAVARAYLGEEL